MSPNVAFSRLQLAAALIEYDNDTDDASVPKRSAQESAIFAHFRQNPIRPNLGARKSDYLGVSLPSETCSTAGMDSNMAKRRSRSSLDTLRNPFSGDNQSELGLNEEYEDELEVDLESWGLDAFVSKDKNRSKAKGKEPAYSSTRSQQPLANYESSAASPRRGVVTSKSVSLGGRVEFRNALSMDRRRSLASPLELAGMESDILFPPRSPTSRPSFAQPRPQMLTDTSAPNDEARTQIIDTTNSKNLLNAPERRRRSASTTTLEMLKPTEDNPFAIERPSQTSRFDPKAPDRPRSYSNASMDSRLMQENDFMPENSYAKERPYSTLDLLRPKVLVMPSPLQPIAYSPDPEPTSKVRDGFELSTDGPPLPPGARSSRRLSSFSTLNPSSNFPIASNAFTLNPLLDLSLSQKTFRNTLIIGGQPTLTEIELPRATQDGDQIQLDPPVGQDDFPANGEEVPLGSGRPAGKLFGKSLIDDLEARKAELRSKQRVFKGDDRPSMMARKQLRSSTLIDPATLADVTIKTADTRSNPARRGSLSTKPLLDFNSDEKALPRNVRTGTTQIKETRSVFGIDTLWEREMEKLKEIQLREAVEDEENRRAEAESELKKHVKKKKHKNRGNDPTSVMDDELQEMVKVSPPTLPNIQRASTRRLPPKHSDVEEPSDSDDEQNLLRPVDGTESWHVGSSDEDDHGPRRTTGIGPRYPKRATKIQHPSVDDSDEDIPLVATVHKAKARATLASSMQAISDDEDKPLAQVMRHAKPKALTPSVQPRLVNLASDSNSEDEQPLGLRASRLPRNQRSMDEDDVPLALQSQQHQTHYQLLAQQRQQQLLMQAQMQNSMFMNLHSPMMGGFYGAVPLLNAMPMQTPVSIPSPPPVVDDINFGRVDRWRRDVIVDGEI